MSTRARRLWADGALGDGAHPGDMRLDDARPDEAPSAPTGRRGRAADGMVTGGSVRERVWAAWFENLRPRYYDGNAVELLERGEQYFPALERELAAAREEVFLETYIFEDDASGRRIAEALAAAARRGVRVHVTIDGYGCSMLGPALAEQMRSAGVRIEVFRPERRRFALNRQRLRRLHRKVVVIDRRVALVGGINIQDDYYDQNHGALEQPRFDFATRIEGPVLRPIYYAVHRHWWTLAMVNRALHPGGKGELAPPGDRPRARGQPAASADWDGARLPEPSLPAPRRAGDMRAMFVLRDNFRFRYSIERAYLQAIRRARREILIANAYFFPGTRFRRALFAAARRGVRVRLLLQGRVEYALQHYASQAMYDDLLRRGIEIVEYEKSFLHAKVAVIDDWATVGSSNIDPFSLLLAREANVVIDDARFARQLRERLEAAMAEGGRPVEAVHLQRRRWPVRVLQWFAYGMLRLGVALTGVSGRY